MSVGSVGSGTQVGDLMKLLESGQQQSVDLAKKMIKVAVAEKVQSVSSGTAEGLGQCFDCLA